MTTALYDRRTKTLGADTQNTDGSGTIYRVAKIEKLKTGWYFLGSGNCYTIGLCRQWAEDSFKEASRPDFALFLEDKDEYGFSCLAISPDGASVWLVDDEMSPMPIEDEYVGIGSGSAYAIGALDAGASVEQALAIAANRDPSTSAPFNILRIS